MTATGRHDDKFDNDGILHISLWCFTWHILRGTEISLFATKDCIPLTYKGKFEDTKKNPPLGT